MAEKIMTAGYTSHNLTQLVALAEQLEATIVDIRFKARSGNPMWQKWSLEKALGARYIHIPEWGNPNYLTPELGIKIDDFLAGFATVRSIPGVVILLCGCKDFVGCHREKLSGYLQIMGVQTEEVTWP
jgi:hypothetical protein